MSTQSLELAHVSDTSILSTLENLSGIEIHIGLECISSKQVGSIGMTGQDGCWGVDVTWLEG